jgi:hypothetical protein
MSVRGALGVAIVALVLLSLSSVHADRGMISVYPGVSVYEPGQKAILAWNGEEEVLILSTDVTSSAETLVLEILPLPSAPVVEAASFQAFERIQSLIWTEGVALAHFGTQSEARTGSVEIVFHEEIGPHNITVVKANDATELVEWMQEFLATSGIDEATSLQNFESVVKEYMTRGFRYYVLDLITVLPEARSVDPILYRFNSSALYYPLLISSPIAGETQITLFLLTEGKVIANPRPMQLAYYESATSTPLGTRRIQLVLSKGELSQIDLRVAELFQDSAWLTVLTFDGPMRWLYQDLMLSHGIASDTSAAFPAELVALCILLGAACTLVGVAATLLITRARRPPDKTSQRDLRA